MKVSQIPVNVVLGLQNLPRKQLAKHRLERARQGEASLQASHETVSHALRNRPEHADGEIERAQKESGEVGC